MSQLVELGSDFNNNLNGHNLIKYVPLYAIDLNFILPLFVM